MDSSAATLTLRYHPLSSNLTSARALALYVRPIARAELAALAAEGECPMPPDKQIETAFHIVGAVGSVNPLLLTVDFSPARSYAEESRVHICYAGQWREADALALTFNRSDLVTLQDGHVLYAPVVHLTPVAVLSDVGADRRCTPGWYGSSCSSSSPWNTRSPSGVLVIMHQILISIGTVLALQWVHSKGQGFRGRLPTVAFMLAAALLAAAGAYSDSPGHDAFLDDHVAARRAVTAIVPLLLVFVLLPVAINGCRKGRAAGREAQPILSDGATSASGLAAVVPVRIVRRAVRRCEKKIMLLVYWALAATSYLMQLSGRPWYGWLVFAFLWVPFLAELFDLSSTCLDCFRCCGRTGPPWIYMLVYFAVATVGATTVMLRQSQP